MSKVFCIDRLGSNSEMMQTMTTDLQLRDIIESDLDIFFQQQLDPEANQMAAFARENPEDQAAFMKHWAKILSDDSISSKTIIFAGQVAGNIMSHSWFGKPEVCYWLGRDFWEMGIATMALDELLKNLTARPLRARVAKDNVASLRVLEKCGFKPFGHDRGHSHARGGMVDELILILD